MTLPTTDAGLVGQDPTVVITISLVFKLYLSLYLSSVDIVF